MRNQKRDANERGIIDALEAIGCTVDQLPGGNGRPDLDVGEPQTQQNIRIEVKVPGNEKLDPLQKTYHREWKGRIHLVSSAEQAIEVVKWYRNTFK